MTDNKENNHAETGNDHEVKPINLRPRRKPASVVNKEPKLETEQPPEHGPKQISPSQLDSGHEGYHKAATSPTSEAPDPAPESHSESSSEYDVGYGKPPRDTQFQKGTSGNPGGRPKGSRNTKTLLLEMLDGNVTMKINGQPMTITRREAMLLTLMQKALTGDTKSISMIMSLVSALEDARDEAMNKTMSSADEKAFEHMLKDLRRRASHDESGETTAKLDVFLNDDSDNTADTGEDDNEENRDG